MKKQIPSICIIHFVLRIELSLSQLHADQRITLAALAKAIGGGWSGK